MPPLSENIVIERNLTPKKVCSFQAVGFKVGAHLGDIFNKAKTQLPIASNDYGINIF